MLEKFKEGKFKFGRMSVLCFLLSPLLYVISNFLRSMIGQRSYSGYKGYIDTTFIYGFPADILLWVAVHLLYAGLILNIIGLVIDKNKYPSYVALAILIVIVLVAGGVGPLFSESMKLTYCAVIYCPWL